MIIKNLTWVQEIIQNAEDVIIFCIYNNTNEDYEPDSFIRLREILDKKFNGRKIQLLKQNYKLETAEFPMPAEKVYFFHPKNEMVLGCFSPEFALAHLTQMIYHAESLWKKRPIRELLDRDGIYTDEDLKRYQPEDVHGHPIEVEYPSYWSMAKTLYRTGKDVLIQGIKNRKVFATDKLQAERLDTCRGCDYFVPNSNRCTKCGCAMEQKVKLIAAECPIGKW